MIPLEEGIYLLKPEYHKMWIQKNFPLNKEIIKFIKYYNKIKLEKYWEENDSWSFRFLNDNNNWHLSGEFLTNENLLKKYLEIHRPFHNPNMLRMKKIIE